MSSVSAFASDLDQGKEFTGGRLRLFFENLGENIRERKKQKKKRRKKKILIQGIKKFGFFFNISTFINFVFISPTKLRIFTMFNASSPCSIWHDETPMF